jgi:hypothetical protein
VHGEEIGRVVELPDQDSGEFFERFLRRQGFGPEFREHRRIGVLIAQLIKRESYPPEQNGCLRHRCLVAPEQMQHLGMRFEIPLGIDLKPCADGRQRPALADAGQHILQRPAFGRVVEHVADRHQRQIMLPRQPGKACHMALVSAAMGTRHGQIQMIGKGFAQLPEHGFKLRTGGTGRRDDGHQQALAMGEQILERQMAFALWRAALSGGQQFAETAPGRAVLGPDQDVGRSVHEHQPAAGGKGKPRLLRRHVAADDAGQRIAVGDGDAAKTKPRGLHHQFLGMRCAAQEGEIAGSGEFDIGLPDAGRAHIWWRYLVHANSPCMYQAGSLVSRP